MVSHTCNPSTQEAEAGGLWVWDSLGYIVRSCLKGKKKADIRMEWECEKSLW
jgi:hypothetical protein